MLACSMANACTGSVGIIWADFACGAVHRDLIVLFPTTVTGPPGGTLKIEAVQSFDAQFKRVRLYQPLHAFDS